MTALAHIDELEESCQVYALVFVKLTHRLVLVHESKHIDQHGKNTRKRR